MHRADTRRRRRVRVRQRRRGTGLDGAGLGTTLRPARLRRGNPPTVGIGRSGPGAIARADDDDHHAGRDHHEHHHDDHHSPVSTTHTSSDPSVRVGAPLDTIGERPVGNEPAFWPDADTDVEDSSNFDIGPGRRWASRINRECS